MATSKILLEPGGQIELLSADLTATGNGDTLNLTDMRTNLIFGIVVSGGTVNLTAEIRHSMDGDNWAILFSFNGGSAITSAKTYIQAPKKTERPGRFIRLRAVITDGQIDQTQGTSVFANKTYQA